MDPQAAVRRLGIALLLMLVGSQSLLAQDSNRTRWALDALGLPSTPGSYGGAIRDSLMRPIPEAELFLSGAAGERTTRASATGVFDFTDLPPGRYALFVRRLGYAPEQRVIYVEAGERRVTIIKMRGLPVYLPDVEVRAKSGLTRAPDAKGMYRTAWGRTLTAADIERSAYGGLPFLVGRYLRTQPLSRFDLLPPSNGWDPFGRTPRAPRAGPIRGCPPAISLNGGPAFRDIFVGDFPPSIIEAIDIYQPGPDSRLPAAFQVPQQFTPGRPGVPTRGIAACGLIVLWTR